ncbi:hypothetical protein N665_0599s0005 [Sinapis alba]|nr:hypothetical protein N665_0599s0005 [Sinapis alba]
MGPVDTYSISPVRRRFSRSEKGKGVSTKTSPPKDAPLSPILMESAMRAHHNALADTASLSVEHAQLVRDSEVQFRGDGDGHCAVGYAEEGVPDKDRSVPVVVVRNGEEGVPDKDRSVPVVVVRNAEERVSRHEVVDGEIRRLTPFRYNRDRLVEQLPDLPPKRSRRATVEGQEWADVYPTCSTRQSVSSLLKGLKAYGVTFIIPRSDQHLWSPPVGYQCVYESFFGEDSKLWIPIPRLITSYCYRRDITLSQLMNGAVRIAVALMVMAAEIDVSMSVRVFKEITQTQPKPNSLFAVHTRSGLQILTGHPTKTRCWQLHYFYIRANGAVFEEPPSDEYRFFWNPRIVTHPNTIGYPDNFWEDVPKIAALSQHKWGDFDRRRICRERQRISKGSDLFTRYFFVCVPLTNALLFSVADWASNVPCRESKGKRLRLPTMGKISREYPNYSEILGARLGGEGLHSMGEAEKAVDEKPIPTRKARSAKKKKNKPAKKPRLSPQHDEEPIEEADGGEGRSPSETRGSPGDNRSPGPVSDDADGDRTLSPRGSPAGEQGASAGSKRRELPAESAQEPGDGCRDFVDRLVPPHRALWDGKTPPTKEPPIATLEAVNFRYNGDTPLAMARKNLLVLEYELALRKVVAELIKAEDTIRTKDGEFEKMKKDILEKAKRVVAERNLHYRECKQAVKKAVGLEADLEAARATIAWLKKEKAEEADRAKKEMDRLRRSRFHEVSCERNRVMTGVTLKCNRRFDKFRKYMAHRDSQESKLFLHSQASGTLQSMDLLGKWGIQVPQKLKDILTEDEARFRKEAEVEEINDQDLVLSPLCIEPLFGFDQFGSNLGTVDSTTAASLRSPAPKDTASAVGSEPSPAVRPDPSLSGRGRCLTSLGPHTDRTSQFFNP